jgi:hypothetical protein
MVADPVEAALLVVEILEELGISYAIGGSVASSLHGETRTTQDADIVADMNPSHVGPFVQRLGDRFYADEETIREAVCGRRMFNVIHLGSVFKVDIHPTRAETLSRQQLARRKRELIRVDPDRFAYIVSPEDIVLQKLEWYRLGGGVSDQQWRDVLGVLKVQADRLDRDYLQRLAESFDLADLLRQALQEAGVESV